MGAATPKGGYVYLLANHRRTTLYAGVTNDLHRRVREHREGKGSAFVRRYKLKVLVYYEWFDCIEEAIEAEKRIKGRSRSFKEALIREVNPGWDDLYPSLPLSGRG